MEVDLSTIAPFRIELTLFEIIILTNPTIKLLKRCVFYTPVGNNGKNCLPNVCCANATSRNHFNVIRIVNVAILPMYRKTFN